MKDNTPSGFGHYPAHYFLWCHAIELSFKAYLILVGWQTERCRSTLGHDLSKAQRSVEEASGTLALSEQAKAVVDVLSDMHSKSHTFRYRPQQMYSFPNQDITRDATNEVVACMEQLLIKTSAAQLVEWNEKNKDTWFGKSS